MADTRRDLAIVRAGDDQPNKRRALQLMEQMEQMRGMSPKPATAAGEIAQVTRAAIEAAIGYGSEIAAELSTVHDGADGSRTVSSLSFRYRR